jgi:hypothetical protein
LIIKELLILVATKRTKTSHDKNDSVERLNKKTKFKRKNHVENEQTVEVPSPSASGELQAFI